MADPLLRAVDVSKRFGRLPALSDVTFSLARGEVLGLVGRRGAGKSTLFQLLCGVFSPTAGELLWDEKPLRLKDPHEAQNRGIEIVHQTPKLVEQLTVVENIFLGREADHPYAWTTLEWEFMVRSAQALLAEFELPASLLQEPVRDLSNEYRQLVVLARVLRRPCRVLLLDDALTALSFQRQERLLERIKKLAVQGTAVIISSDDLKHLFAVTDRIVVLYEGRLVADRRTSESTPREIVELMVGTPQQEQITPLIWALESYHAAQQQAEDLRRAQASLRQSLVAQESLNRQLIERLHNQVVALDQLNAALQATQRRLMTEREEERKALARELHDQVMQDLLSFNYRLEELEGAIDSEALGPEVNSIRNGIRQVVGELRQMCSDLRPPTIDRHGLSAAISSLAQEWAEHNDIQLYLEIDPELGRLPEMIELSVFRIVQEGLNNIRKHAAARHVQLSLQRTSTASLLVRLADDGQGLSAPADLAVLSARKHFGLVGISERVALLGGTMHIESSQGSGMALQVEIPSPYPMGN